MQTNAIEPAFLHGDGEMRGLIRSKDWSVTPLGEISDWPDSLLLSISIMLDNPFPMSIIWGTERIQLYNDAYRPILGSSKHPTALGSNVLETFSEINSTLKSMFDEVFEGNSVRYQELKLAIERNGYVEDCYFNFSYSPIREKNGSISGVLAVVSEITDTVAVRASLENSKKVLNNMIIQSPVAMAIFRGSEHIVDVANIKVLELWGRTEEEALNRPIFEVLPEAGKQGLKDLMYNVYSTGERFVANEMPVALYRDGYVETVYVNFVYESIMKDDPVNSGVLSVAIDVTEQVNARHRVEEANSELEKSNAALAQFAYIASHDLQEPVRKISTFTQMLEQSLGDITGISKRYLDKIYTSTDRMSFLIRDVLAYSRVSIVDNFDIVNLNEIIKGVTTDFDLVIDEIQAEIRSTNLPNITAISSQMTQLFDNLMSNSLKYRNPDVKPSILISSEILQDPAIIKQYGIESNARYHHIKFSDNGIGFDEAHKFKIFKIFQRLHGKMEYEGTGIGLAICEKIVQNHQGHIFAEVDKDGGAIFNILLPEKLTSNIAL